jgi:hypothetical protein
MRRYIIRHIDSIIFSIIVTILLFIVAFPLFTTTFPEYLFTANNAFSGFGVVEEFVNEPVDKIEQFRWSGSISSIVFRKQWSDYYRLGCNAKQITTLEVYAPGQHETTMYISGIQALIDDRPRHIYLLQCLKTQIKITSSSSFEPTSDEPRKITFAIKEVKRQAYPIFIRKYTKWVSAVVVSMAFVILSFINLWLLDRRPKFTHALLVSLLMLVYWRQFTSVSIELLPLLVGCIVTTLVLKPHISARTLRWLFWLIVIAVPLWRIGMMWRHVGTDWDLTIYPISTVAMIPLVYQPYWLWLCIIASAQILYWIKSPDTQIDAIWWVLLVSMSVLLQSIVGYWVVSGWQNTINITDYKKWSDLWELLTVLRIAMPPVLLVIEFAIRNYPALQVVYGWCLPIVVITVCMMLLIGNSSSKWYNRFIRIVLTMIMLSVFIIIKGTQNFFIYDILTGFCLIVFCQLWLQQTYTPVRLLMMGLVLVLFDMLRPFTMVFTPLFAALVMYDIYKKHGWQRLIYFCVPLTIIVVWHFNHIFVLGQLNWSNHAGFNICGAWRCPPITLIPEQEALHRGLWPYINTSIHQENSQRLLHWFVEYLQANPSVILPTLSRLVQNNLFITRTSLEYINPVIATIFTLFYFGGFILQGAVFVHGIVVLRGQSFWVWVRDPKNIFFWYSAVLLCMFVITTITESGENYRWIMGFVLVLGYLPDNIIEILQVLATRFKLWVRQANQLAVVPHNE